MAPLSHTSRMSGNNRISYDTHILPLAFSCSQVQLLKGSEIFCLGGVGGGLLGMCCWPLRTLPHYSLFFGQLDPILTTLDPNLVTFCLCIYLINLLTTLNTVTFFLLRIIPFFLINKIPFSYPQNPKMCNLKMQRTPIVVNPVVKMRPHPAAHPHYPISRKYPPRV